jgi:PHD/YefM family antitoxin component YafN of YafNO toxin-antitoxin module
MLDLTVKDVHPLSDFKRRTAEFLGRLRKHRRPLLLTLNGRAEMVVLNADSYQELIDRVKKLEAEASVAGRTALRAKAV